MPSGSNATAITHSARLPIDCHVTPPSAEYQKIVDWTEFGTEKNTLQSPIHAEMAISPSEPITSSERPMSQLLDRSWAPHSADLRLLGTSDKEAYHGHRHTASIRSPPTCSCRKETRPDHQWLFSAGGGRSTIGYSPGSTRLQDHEHGYKKEAANNRRDAT